MQKRKGSIKLNYLLFSFANIGQAALQALLAPLFLLKMSLEQIGYFEICVMLTNIFSTVILCGNQSGLYFARSEMGSSKEFKRYSFTGFVFIIILLCLCSISSIFIFKFISSVYFSNKIQLLTFVSMIAISFGRAIFAYSFALLKLNENNKTFLVLSLLNNIILIFSQIICVFFISQKYEDVILSMAISSLFLVLIYIFYFRNEIELKFCNLKVFYRHWNRGSIDLINSGGEYVYRAIEKYFINTFLGISYVGLIAIMTKLVNALALIVYQPFTASWHTELFKRVELEGIQKAINYYQEITPKINSIFTVIGIFMAYLAIGLHSFSYVREFNIHIDIFIPIILFSTNLTTLLKIFEGGFNIIRKVEYTIIVSFVMLSIMCLLNYYFLSIGGLKGFFAAIALGRLIAITLSVIFQRKISLLKNTRILLESSLAITFSFVLLIDNEWSSLLYIIITIPLIILNFKNFYNFFIRIITNFIKLSFLRRLALK